MRTYRLDQGHRQPTSSRLERSLLRLQDARTAGPAEGAPTRTLLETWRRRWSRNADEIARRLELIEAQLDAGPPDAAVMHNLTVLPAPAEADDITAMGAF